MICFCKGVKFFVVLLLNNPMNVSPPELKLIWCLITTLQTEGGREYLVSKIHVD